MLGPPPALTTVGLHNYQCHGLVFLSSYSAVSDTSSTLRNDIGNHLGPYIGHPFCKQLPGVETQESSV